MLLKSAAPSSPTVISLEWHGNTGNMQAKTKTSFLTAQFLFDVSAFWKLFLVNITINGGQKQASRQFFICRGCICLYQVVFSSLGQGGYFRTALN
jgi:hypothetical protein